MTTQTVPDPVAVQKPTEMSETAERSIDGEWTRSDTVSGSINPGCLAFCSKPQERWMTAADPAYSRRWLILAVVGVAQVMVVVDATVVNIVLPSAQRALHFSNGDRQWVVTAYARAFVSLLPLGGRIGDLFGRTPHVPDRPDRFRRHLCRRGSR